MVGIDIIQGLHDFFLLEEQSKQFLFIMLFIFHVYILMLILTIFGIEVRLNFA